MKSAQRFRRLNRATIFNSREFVAHHTGGLQNTAVHRSLLDVRTQRKILPILRGAALSPADKDRDSAQRQAPAGAPFSHPFDEV